VRKTIGIVTQFLFGAILAHDVWFQAVGVVATSRSFRDRIAAFPLRAVDIPTIAGAASLPEDVAGVALPTIDDDAIRVHFRFHFGIVPVRGAGVPVSANELQPVPVVPTVTSRCEIFRVSVGYATGGSSAFPADAA